MNCCDYKCNQGRDCPARCTPKPATDLPTPTAPLTDDTDWLWPLLVMCVSALAVAFAIGFLSGYALQFFS